MKASFRTLRRLARYVWAAPNTLVGLSLGVLMLCLGGRSRLERGAAEFSGGLLSVFARKAMGRNGFSAITLGHVIVGVSTAELAAVREHEHVHVRQYEQWGPFFLLAYAASSAWQFVRGRRCYRDNFFEAQAYGAASPLRPDPCIGPERRRALQWLMPERSSVP